MLVTIDSQVESGYSYGQMEALWREEAVVLYPGDHAPKHVHVFEDGKRCLKFDIESWTVIEGRLSPKARRALKALQVEGAFDEKSKV